MGFIVKLAIPLTNMTKGNTPDLSGTHFTNLLSK